MLWSVLFVSFYLKRCLPRPLTKEREITFKNAMNVADTEIELQMSVERSEPLVDFLKKNGRFEREIHQVDEYFSPPHRDFLAVRPVKEWLRLRNEGGRYSINYKNWYFEQDGKTSYYCDEFETEIADVGKVRKIFEALNFKRLVTVDKVRKIWMYGDFEISLDSVKGLGDFVELEYKGGDANADPKKIGQEMIDFLKQVGCGKLQINYQGYPFLLLFPTETKYSEVK